MYLYSGIKNAIFQVSLDSITDLTLIINFRLNYFFVHSNKPPPTVGNKLPLPSSINPNKDKPSLKRKLLDNLEDPYMKKKIQF